jgi:TPR repeat protein
MLAAGSTYAQNATTSRCSLQEMAIDAALGNATAQYNLGVEFYRGEAVPRDYSKAAAMWRRAGEGGITAAFNNLGYLTYNGYGVKQDYAEGVRLWRVAAEKGLAESQVHLGEAYADGKYLRRDYIEAYAWAEAGRYNAEQDIGMNIEPDISRKILEMAKKFLSATRRNLTNAQLAQAETKAKEYIGKFRK